MKTFDAIRELRDTGVVVAGGFHSPMERECLDFLDNCLSINHNAPHALEEGDVVRQVRIFSEPSAWANEAAKHVYGFVKTDTPSVVAASRSF